MAVDTAVKRRSMLNFNEESVPMLPLADGTLSAPDWSHYLGLYSGIALAERGTAPGTDPDKGVAYWGGPIRRITA